MGRQLLFSLTKKDFKIETIRGSGKGGQNRNKRDTAVRITHEKSGAVGYSEDERSQLQNKKKALNRLVDTQEFKNWHKIKANQIMGLIKSPEQLLEEVEQMIQAENLDIEKKVNGRWERYI